EEAASRYKEDRFDRVDHLLNAISQDIHPKLVQAWSATMGNRSNDTSYMIPQTGSMNGLNSPTVRTCFPTVARLASAIDRRAEAKRRAEEQRIAEEQEQRRADAQSQVEQQRRADARLAEINKEREARRREDEKARAEDQRVRAEAAALAALEQEERQREEN